MQVTAFYSYWLGFVTVLDFFWADQYDTMAGPNRKSRRLMEEENKKLRKKARREYNETVRGLAEFVKKRDKRVIDMQIKRNEEIERKKEEEKQRKKELERQKAEKARNFEEAEWTKVEEEFEDVEAEDVEEQKKNELYCVACSKKFKSDKQWRNHEQSKKHKEKVAELREAFSEEDKEYEEAEGNKGEEEEVKEADENGFPYFSADKEVHELEDHFESGVSIQGDESDEGKTESSETNELAYIDKNSRGKGIASVLGSDDDEDSVLEAMLSGHKSRNKVGNKPKAPAKKTQVEVDSDELEFMEYNDTKGSRRNRGGRRRRARRQEEEEKEDVEKEEDAAAKAETKEANVPEENGETKEIDERDDDAVELVSHSLPDSEAKRRDDDATETKHKNPRQAFNKRNTKKKENPAKSKVATRGRKQKVLCSITDFV